MSGIDITAQYVVLNISQWVCSSRLVYVRWYSLPLTVRLSLHRRRSECRCSVQRSTILGFLRNTTSRKCWESELYRETVACSPPPPPPLPFYPTHNHAFLPTPDRAEREGRIRGREGGRKGGREGGRKGGREEGREGGREGGRKGRREEWRVY